MRNKVRWGVLGVAKIATEQVVPAMHKGSRSEVVAIASRDPDRARQAAAELGIPVSHGSYEDLLADPEVDAVYNPLPNHLHVPWSIKAAEAGKHVLCEKPIGLSVAEARELLRARDRHGVKIGEAFMVRNHPQWQTTRDLVAEGRIGELRSVLGWFSYFNDDPTNIRNIPDYGGGGLMDIGCYLIYTARLLFGRPPLRVAAAIERDSQLGVDTLTSLIQDFAPGQAVGACSTQAVPYQRVHILGTRGRIEIEIPFNAPSDRACIVLVDDGSDLSGGGIERIEIEVCNQYTIQGDLFSKAIHADSEVPGTLEDAIENMAVIEAVFRSAESGRWETV
jgi:predicted dehydrogenase